MNPGWLEISEDDDAIFFGQDDAVNKIIKTRILEQLHSDHFCDIFYRRIHELAYVKKWHIWEKRFWDDVASKIWETIGTVPYPFGGGVQYVTISSEGEELPLCDIQFQIVNQKVCYVLGANVCVPFQRLWIGHVLYDLFESLLVAQGVNFIYGNMSEAGANFASKRWRTFLHALDRWTRIRVEKILWTWFTPNHQFNNVYFQKLSSTPKDIIGNPWN